MTLSEIGERIDVLHNAFFLVVGLLDKKAVVLNGAGRGGCRNGERGSQGEHEKPEKMAKHGRSNMKMKFNFNFIYDCKRRLLRRSATCVTLRCDLSQWRGDGDLGATFRDKSTFRGRPR